MTHLKYLIPTLLIVSLVMVNCKKKDEKKPEVNVLCDGNGSSAVFPIQQRNVWRYSHKKGKTMQIRDAMIVFGSEIKLNGKWYQTYYASEELMTGGEHYCRIDPSNGDIYHYSPGFTEFMEIPGDPKMNQQWKYFFSKRTVTNMNAWIQTADCVYSGLIVVTQTNGTKVEQLRYYKKGLGLVYCVIPDAVESRFALKNVSLN